MAAPKKEKPKYVSPYKTILVGSGSIKYVVQYKDNNDLEMEKQRRGELFALRGVGSVNDPEELRMTPYFEKRCANIIQNLYLTKAHDEFIDQVISAANVTMSVYFQYKDYIDIINSKMKQFEADLTDDEKWIMEFVIKSLERNNVIAPKIPQLWKYKTNT